MDKDRLPARPGSGGLTRTGPGGELATRSGQVPSHSARELQFTSAAGSREELWERLGPKIHDRVNAKLGTLVEWWATEYDGRISAVVFGHRALIVVSPVVNSASRGAHRIESRALDEASFRSVRVAEVTGGGAARTSSAPGRAGPRPGEPLMGREKGLASQLGSDMTGFLGHLPRRAQQLLQEPFMSGGNNDLRSDNHYVRLGRSQAIGGAVLQVWCYLADRRFVTFAAGTGHGYHESSGATSWELTCWRAEVAPRARS